MGKSIKIDKNTRLVVTRIVSLIPRVNSLTISLHNDYSATLCGCVHRVRSVLIPYTVSLAGGVGV